MIIRRANEQDIKAILHSFPEVKSVLCTGIDGYTLLALDNNNLIAFASVFKREIPAPLKGKKEDFRNTISAFLLEDDNQYIVVDSSSSTNSII